MPKYYFHLRDRTRFIEETHGLDLPDEVAAREEAMKAAREILAEMVIRGELIDGQAFIICDDAGREVAIIPLKSAMKIDDE